MSIEQTRVNFTLPSTLFLVVIWITGLWSLHGIEMAIRESKSVIRINIPAVTNIITNIIQPMEIRTERVIQPQP